MPRPRCRCTLSLPGKRHCIHRPRQHCRRHNSWCLFSRRCHRSSYKRRLCQLSHQHTRSHTPQCTWTSIHHWRGDCRHRRNQACVSLHRGSCRHRTPRSLPSRSTLRPHIQCDCMRNRPPLHSRDSRRLPPNSRRRTSPPQQRYRRHTAWPRNPTRHTYIHSSPCRWQSTPPGCGVLAVVTDLAAKPPTIATDGLAH